MAERRFENRFACADLVRVDWTDDQDRVHTTEGVLEDISKIGACVQVEEPIPNDVDVTIGFAEIRLSGKTCYCAFRDYGYFVGMHFRDDSMWSDTDSAPAHLTDLRELAHLAAEA